MVFHSKERLVENNRTGRACFLLEEVSEFLGTPLILTHLPQQQYPTTQPACPGHWAPQGGSLAPLSKVGGQWPFAPLRSLQQLWQKPISVASWEGEEPKWPARPWQRAQGWGYMDRPQEPPCCHKQGSLHRSALMSPGLLSWIHRIGATF